MATTRNEKVGHISYLVHDSADAIVAALARVDVGILQSVRILAVALRRAGRLVAGVACAVRRNGSRVIAAVRVKV